MRLSIFYWLFISLNLVLETGCSRPQTTAPRVVFLQTEVSAIPDHGHVRHRFKFRNEGSEKLEILRVTSSCGCTIAQLGQRSLVFGEESFIEANMTVRPSRRESFITVITNDPANREVILRIRAEGTFPPEFEFLPNSILVNLPVGGTVKADVFLRLTEWKESNVLGGLEGLQLFSVSPDSRLKILRKASVRLNRELLAGGAIRIPGRDWSQIDKPDRIIWLLPLQLEYKAGNDIGFTQTPVVARLGCGENELTALLLFSVDTY